MKTESLISVASAACLALALGLTLGACATVRKVPQAVEAPVTQEAQRAAQQAAAVPEARRLKRKIAVARFTNETRYGRTLLRDDANDPLGKQASDMLVARLVESGRFLVFERQDLAKLEKEQEIIGQADLIGVDSVILGSLTEFGRTTTGKRGFMSSTKKQTARAKVEVRLVDPRTAHAFFAASGSGEAETESGQVAGWGSAADYDATLNDRAIAAAISDLLNALVSKLAERPWRTDILKADGKRLWISGGEHQGLRSGDELLVYHRGEEVRSTQSGMIITLPAEKVARIRIVSFFGDDEWSEGSQAELLSGSLDGYEPDELFVAESEEERS